MDRLYPHHSLNTAYQLFHNIYTVGIMRKLELI